MLTNIILIIYTIIIGALITLLFILRNKYKHMSFMYAKSEIEKYIYVEQLNKEIEDKENSRIENTDGFLKFISQSRDWAFEYIENAQSGISIFLDEIKEIQDSGATPKVALNKILKATVILKEFLPEEINKEKKKNE